MAHHARPIPRAVGLRAGRARIADLDEVIPRHRRREETADRAHALRSGRRGGRGGRAHGRSNQGLDFSRRARPSEALSRSPVFACDENGATATAATATQRRAAFGEQAPCSSTAARSPRSVRRRGIAARAPAGAPLRQTRGVVSSRVAARRDSTVVKLCGSGWRPRPARVALCGDHAPHASHGHDADEECGDDQRPA